MTEEEKIEKVEKLIDELTNDLKPLVQQVEGKLALTMNHYGDYMGMITKFAGGDRKRAVVFCHALLRAGANKEGVKAAFHFCFNL